MVHLAPKGFTVLGKSKVNGVWMQLGTEQGNPNTLITRESLLLFPELFNVRKGDGLK